MRKKVSNLLLKLKDYITFDVNEFVKTFQNNTFDLYFSNYKTVLNVVFFENIISSREYFYIELYRYLKTYFKKSNINKIVFDLNLVNDSIKLTLAKEEILNNWPEYNVKLQNNLLIVDYQNKKYSNFDSFAIKQALNKLKISEEMYSFINVKYKINIKNYNNNTQNENKNSSNDRQYINHFKNIKADYKEITELPKTEAELFKLKNPKVEVEGEIFALEEKEIKNYILYTIDITNYKESTTIKFFSKEKLDLKVGNSINVIGVIMKDNFTKNIIINVSQKEHIKKIDDINFIKEKDLYGLFDNIEDERVELHTHSTFSTQDGLTSVEEYFKNAKKFGIKALTICDHENVEAYPDIYKFSKEYNIKPIYGVELNVFNPNEFKIYYKANNISQNVVGLDIETTGLSNLYDEIIEISAYKYNGEIREEYSKLIKLDNPDLLTPKITELTNIKKEMLENEGINIKDALIGLLDFIGDRTIVAHNATFDVYFLEQKIKKYLNKEINFSFIDTLNFSRIMLKDMKRFSLDKVCKKLKVDLEQHHRAIYDAKACFDIFFKLMEMLEEKNTFNIETIKDDEEIKLSIKETAKKKYEDTIKLLDELNLKYIFENNSKVENKINGILNVKLYKKDYENIINFINENNLKLLEERVIKEHSFKTNFEELNSLIKKEDIKNFCKFNNIVCLIKNQNGLKELYKLISKSNIYGITSRGNVLSLDDLKTAKENNNLLFGSGSTNGYFRQVYENDINKRNDVWFNFFDYIELQPLDNYLAIDDNPLKRERIKETVLKIIGYAKEKKKLIVFDTNSHYLYPKLKEYRDCFINTYQVGGIMHPLRGAQETGQCPMYSTSHLIKVLKKDYGLRLPTIKKYIFDNPNTISNLIDDNIKVIPDKLYAPTDDFLKDKVLDIVGHNVPSVLKEFQMIVENAVEDYKIEGKLPKYIKNRLKKELDSIIGHGFYIIYYIAYLLVKKSNMDGYVVGSRGSVGSSFVANLMGITEVNSLKPHYICPKCHYQIYKDEKSIIPCDDEKLRNNLNEVLDGFDLPDEICPICGSHLKRDGHDIPFETFLGFNGDKTPDIDLNFSGDYQGKAHNFCKEVFGEKHAFRAGTIGTVAEKTAMLYLKDYYIKKDINLSETEIKRRSQFLTNVKRTTGQHPGGIIIIPENMEIYDFTPIQYPANKPQDWFTTHLDYNAIHENVLKMDILGHDDPTILKFLMDNVKENPNDYPFNSVKDIPINDKKILSYLRKDENGIVKSLGIPEFGTNFVRGMLTNIEPQSFYELVKTSGLSHGENVWEKNAESLINGTTNYGIINFKDTIGCRDDIMVQLLSNHLEPKDAFDIMEFVRKGKVRKEPEKWLNYKEIMKKKKVPDWYIWSCEQIKYMFPKAHAVAYVMSALRIAWFKANKPLDFYQAFFSVRATNFDALTIVSNDAEFIQNKIDSINDNKTATQVEKDSITYLEVAKEMIDFGFKFAKPNINKSHANKFLKLNDKTLLMPFSVINGVGEKTALSVYENRTVYHNIDELKKIGKADKKFIEGMNELNALDFTE